MSVPHHHFRGSHYGVGHQMGRAFASDVHAALRRLANYPPPLPPEQVQHSVALAMQITRQTFPEVLQEIEGMADGAGVSVSDLFLDLYEELWDDHHKRPLDPSFNAGCTDIVATGAATESGRTLIGHTDDEHPEKGKPHLMTMEFDSGQPSIRGISLGCRLFSVGQNSAGIVETGNTLISNDVKVGVPRMMMVRAILSARTLEEAVKISLTPHRASIYNTVLADRTGRVINLEASATDAAIIPLRDNRLAHANHYIHPDLLKYEAKHIDHKASSFIRYETATKMLHATRQHTPETFRTILSNHHGYPDSICRHGDRVRTIFAAIYEPELGKLWLHEGYPCQWHAPLQ